MKIIELNIKSFGKLRGVKITPIDGVNIIYGENEAGKSTIMAFILSMFYGIGKGEQRHHYEPWAGGKCTGMITFEYDEKEYALSRQFGASRSYDRTELWCTTLGQKLELPENTEPGEFILKINKETFINSVFIGQAGTAIHGNNNEILAKLTNLAASGDETASKSEITARLTEAASTLRSRRATAILPNLEKQRMTLLEERAAVVGRTSEADTLRDDITRLTNRRNRLSGDLEMMRQQLSLKNDITRLARLEDIIHKKEACDAAQKKYEKLHNAMFSGGGLDSQFLDDARGLLDGYTSQQVAIRMKQEQLDACDRKINNVDRAPLSKLRVVKKYLRPITDALDDYTELKARRADIERKIDEAPEKSEPPVNIPSVIIVATAIVVILLLLGIGLSPICFILAAIVAIIAAAYVIIAKKGIVFEGLPKDNIEIQNISSDIREITRAMRPILDEMEVGTMDELEAALHNIDRIHTHISDLQKEKDDIANELESMREELAQILQELKTKLYPYKNVSSDAEAVKIISTLGRIQCDHAALETKYKTEEASYLSALGEMDFDLVCIEADDLREKLGEDADLSENSFTPDLEESIEICLGELETVKADLVKKETELEMMNSDPQMLNKLTDEIKLVTSRIDRYEFEYKAIQEAIEALGIAFESMQKDFGPIINFRASRIVEALTGEKYGSVLISEALVPSVAEPGGSIRSVNNLSAGTTDQIYLALRLAISGILPQENLPLLLDDAFAQYDDKRMTDALRYIGAENAAGRLGQIMLFTCHDRILYAAKENGLTRGIVRLK